MMSIRHQVIYLSLLLFPLWSATADLRDEVDEVISLTQAPSGVVFEIISGDPDRLVTLVPTLRQESERLRARFQGLSIAIVTHGAEQFALTTDKADRYRPLHSLVKQMTTADDIPVHVCGTHPRRLVRYSAGCVSRLCRCRRGRAGTGAAIRGAWLPPYRG